LTGYGWTTGGQFPEGTGSFLATTSRPAVGPTLPPIQWASGDLIPGIKRSGGDLHSSIRPHSVVLRHRGNNEGCILFKFLLFFEVFICLFLSFSCKSVAEPECPKPLTQKHTIRRYSKRLSPFHILTTCFSCFHQNVSSPKCFFNPRRTPVK
jgi:hypothetical protein